VLMKTGGFRPTAEAERAPARTPVGINLGVGAVVIVVGALVAAGVPAAHRAWRLDLVVVAVAVAAAVTADHLAMAAVVPLGWLVTDGFLENRSGELTWHGSTDMYLILLLVMAAAIGLAAGEARAQLAARSDSRRKRTR
jgi:hypothetical protein